MTRSIKPIFFLLFVHMTDVVSAGETARAIEVIRISNETLFFEITPDIGGRLLTFSRQGKENFLEVGEAAVRDNPDPHVDAMAENIGYFGHEMWVGPQSAWWTQQDINAERLAAKAVWPPDPYLVLGKNKIISQGTQQVTLQSPASPVSGVQLQKTYRLLTDQPDAIQLEVVAQNIRQQPVSWDIWFNTRVRPETKVYVPIKSEADVRIAPFPGDHLAPPAYRIEQGLFTFDPILPPTGKRLRRGKAFIQPSNGWMAGFYGDQLLIIQFELQARASIHPEQGQVELYLDYEPGNTATGLLEMEVHAPY
jgi:hypothetical protein